MISSHQETTHFIKLLEQTRKMRQPPYDCQLCCGTKLCDTKLLCCHQTICIPCIRQLSDWLCPYCRKKIEGLDMDTMSILTIKHEQFEDYKKHKDFVASSYLQLYPTFDSNNIYTALIYLEDSDLLLEMQPNEILFLLETS